MSDHDNDKDPGTGVSRRKFLVTAATTGAGLTIIPRHVLGRGFVPPSDKLNIAGVGVGGMGRSNLTQLSSQNIVALCDVDWDFAGKAYDRLDTDIPQMQTRLSQAGTNGGQGAGGGRGQGGAANMTPEQRATARQRAEGQLQGMINLRDQAKTAKRYTDFREMLDKQKDIDAVMVATADHTHAVIASYAMDLNKHVYVQKPLTWSVHEARHLAKKAKDKPKVATQMGNQGHSMDDARRAVEMIQAGVIGEIKEVHVWTNRPLGYWAQGVPRPEPLKAKPETLDWRGTGVTARLAAALAGNYPVPDKLAWDLFLGPAPFVEYHPIYHPHNWRGWVDWGGGAIGDMGAHLIDHPVWSLDLGFPTAVETVSTPFNKASYPLATTTYYEFPARGSRPAVKLTWYDGAMLPPQPEELGEEKVNPGGGIMYIGSKGKLMQDTYGLNPRLLPKSLADAYTAPPQKLPRITTSHEMNWVEAAKGSTKASSPFEYAAPLTEIMLLGVVALRAGRKISYDGANMRVTNAPAANEFLTREYRAGWKLL